MKSNGYLAPFWNIEIAHDTDFDRDLLSILHKYGAFVSCVQDTEYKKRTETISSGIAKSGLFSEPELIHSYWEKNYTADEYFGFVMTGNVFVQNPEAKKQACYEELVQLAAKHNGIKRHYICELYCTKKLE